MKRVLITGGKGYIGTRLRSYLAATAGILSVDSVDTEIFGSADELPNKKTPYQSLRSEDIAPYDVIIHLAAHSSVAWCVREPREAAWNNIAGFSDLLSYCRGKRLIYASSSSVYNGSRDKPIREEECHAFEPTNRYDVSKYAMDLLAHTSSDVSYYGLRLGTVCGWSPQLRSDLMINRMTLDARDKGCMTVTNPKVHRPILDIDDLCRSVARLTIAEPGEIKPGIYNLCSLNLTVHEAAARIAEICPARIDVKVGPATYDFSMDASRLWEACGMRSEGSIERIVASLLTHAPVRIGGRL